MRKRVIRSLVLGALAVMVCSFLVLTPILLYTFQTNSTYRAFDEIQTNINHIKPLAQMSLSFRTAKMDRLFNESMEQFAYFSDTEILFFDSEGDVIWANNIVDHKNIDTYISEALRLFDEGDRINASGLFNGLYDKSTISVGECLRNEFGQIFGYVFCSVTAPDISQQYREVFYDILIIELVTLCFVAFFMFLFSRNITKPLKKINNTLKEFARGNFDARVKYDVNNELGELAFNINQMADSINSLEKMRQDFVSDISHELRTPMTSISGFIEGILDGTIPKEEEDKYLEIALSESKRLSKLTNDLLTLTRIEDQVKSLNITEFDIEELTKLVLIKFEDSITNAEIDVDIELEGEEFIVRADKDKYTQVLTNLIHNAVKFTPHGGKIVIALRKAQDKCLLSIKNNGYGIESDKLRFIWERFYKADNSRSHDRTGVGIGLYIVKKIIDAHDENITVSSVVNEYTIFEFTVALA